MALKDMSDLLEAAGPVRSADDLEQLVKKLDYSDLDHFFEDNPGALDALVDWLGEANDEHHRMRLEESLIEDGVDLDEDEDDDLEDE